VDGRMASLKKTYMQKFNDILDTALVKDCVGFEVGSNSTDLVGKLKVTFYMKEKSPITVVFGSEYNLKKIEKIV
jgi:hypothetical protein